MRSLLIAFLLIVDTTVAQATHVVDATGRVGKFRSVVAAMQAAKSGDKILIHPGTYVGTLDPQGKGLALIGVTGKAYDVLIQSSVPQGTVLLVRSLNSGSTLRFSSLTFDSGSIFGTVVILGFGNGDVFFENIWSGQSWFMANWNGTISLANCLAKVTGSALATPQYAFEFDKVRQVFIRDCVIESNFSSAIFAPTVGVSLKSCHAEIVQTTITGPYGVRSGSLFSGNGGTGLSLVSSRVRISGDGTDIIAGGRSQTWPNTTGGYGVSLQGSTLDWSGTTIRGGAAIGAGNAGKPFFVGPFSRVTNVQPSIPLLRPRGKIARGSLSTVGIQASPYALSLTWLSTAIRPAPTPLGVLAIDLSQPSIELLLAHGAGGQASFAMDLRNLPASFVGIHFGMQTLAVTTTLVPVLSAPFMKVLR